jgi:2,4-dienoyl-CoA reductase-like NADH-dependent reductase (Old Yellow Enzyme family)
MRAMTTLFDPIRVGDLDLPNRIFMAPLTRARATDDRVPTDIMRDYYVQRASAGLILTEATDITPDSVGYQRTPGIWSSAQVVGWKLINDAVHQAGDSIGAALKREYGGVYVANEKFTVEQSAAALSEGSADAIAFGVKYIANPDLVARLRAGAVLNEIDRNTIYVGRTKGYIDYPAMTDQAVAA